jgi:predicted DNA-binding transcriptional regulator AlpA
MPLTFFRADPALICPKNPFWAVICMEDFLTEKEVAKQIRVSLASLRRWRLVQRGPRFVKLGALVRYRPEDLEQWMDSLPAGGASPERQETRLRLALR